MNTFESLSVDLRDPEIAIKVEGRGTVLFDTNFWIDIAEAKTVQLVRLQDRLRELVIGSRLFCPLTFTTIHELLFQTHASAVRVGALMEDLSLNIAFAPSEDLIIKEVDAAFQMIATNNRPHLGSFDVFVPIMSYFCTEGTLRFPETFPPERRQQLRDHMAQSLRGLGVVEYLDMMKSSMPLPRKEAPPYKAAAVRRREAARDSKELAWRIEAEAVLNQFVLPRLKTLMRTLPDELQVRWRNLPTIRYIALAKYLLPHMPATRHYIDVMTAAGFDAGRGFQMNDFFDLELIKVPLVYSDALATGDKWVKHLLTKEIKGATSRSRRYVWNYDELEEYLASLASLG